MIRDPVQEVQALVDEIDTQLSALRESIVGTATIAIDDAKNARDDLREALRLVTASRDVVACW